jgi:UDP-2-acetamido-3-amino-2,3-dideoxy-glucuronate N-acetyltransferase
MARACLQAGKPIIVEKPLCFDAGTAHSLQQLAEKAGLPVLVNYIHLYNPAYLALKKAVAASGKPVRAILSEGMDLGPFRPDTGTLWDRCPHDVALCLDLMGGSGAGAEVSAFGAFPDSQGRPEMVTLRLRWEGGVTAWIQSGRLSPQKKRTLSVITDRELFHFDEHSPVKCRRIPFDFSGRAGLGSGPLPKEWTPIPVPERPTPMEAMLTAFADQLEKKNPPARQELAGPDGLGLTVELTRLLEECDKLLVPQNKERSCAS